MQNFIEYFFNENKRFIIQKSILFLYYCLLFVDEFYISFTNKSLYIN